MARVGLEPDLQRVQSIHSSHCGLEALQQPGAHLPVVCVATSHENAGESVADAAGFIHEGPTVQGLLGHKGAEGRWLGLGFDLSSNNCAQMLMIFCSSRKIRRRRPHENLKTIPSVDRIIKCECDCK